MSMISQAQLSPQNTICCKEEGPLVCKSLALPKNWCILLRAPSSASQDVSQTHLESKELPKPGAARLRGELGLGVFENNHRGLRERLWRKRKLFSGRNQ